MRKSHMGTRFQDTSGQKFSMRVEGWVCACVCVGGGVSCYTG